MGVGGRGEERAEGGVWGGCVGVCEDGEGREEEEVEEEERCISQERLVCSCTCGSSPDGEELPVNP